MSSVRRSPAGVGRSQRRNSSPLVSSRNIGAMMWSLPFALAAVAFFSTGWVSWTAGSDPGHGSRVAQFNNAVQRWEKVRHVWEKVGNITVRGLVPDGKEVLLLPDDSPDVPLQRGMLSYHPLRFSAKSSFGTLESWSTMTRTLTFAISNKSGVLAEDLPITSEYTSKSGNWKDCVYGKRGSHNDRKRQCVMYRRLSYLCIALQRKVDEGPSPSVSWVSTGKCTASSSLSYEHVPAPQFHDAKGPRKVALIPRITVRSTEDPYLVAWSVTDGSLRFGHSAEEHKKEGLTLFILAGVSSAVAVVIATSFFVGPHSEATYYPAPGDVEIRMPHRKYF